MIHTQRYFRLGKNSHRLRGHHLARKDAIQILLLTTDQYQNSAWFWGADDNVRSHTHIPRQLGVPKWCGGVFLADRSQLGRLNLQTEERVREAAKVIKRGKVVPLK